MITPETRKINRALWQEKKLPGIESSFLEYYAGKTPEIIQAQTESNASFERIALNLSRNAFGLMAGDKKDMSMQAAELLVKISEEALRTESFDRLYQAIDPVTNKPLDRDGELPENAIKPTEKELRIEKLQGKKNTLKHLHYGLWFKTDERPIEMLRKSVEIWKEVYVTRQEDIENLIMNAVEAEDYEFAIQLCKKKCKHAVLPPPNPNFKRNGNYVLYVLCEYALGNVAMKPYARAGVEYWNNQSMKWVPLNANLPWYTRLGWAYLRGKHFTGVTSAKALIHDLRGY